MFKLSSLLVLVMAALFVIAGCEKAEQKGEQAAEEMVAVTLADADVIAAIETHIASALDAEGNYALEDEVAGVTRSLKLDNVHTGVHATDDGSYYACADMTEGEAKLDIDFYVISEEGQAQVSKAVIHKVDDVSRK